MTVDDALTLLVAATNLDLSVEGNTVTAVTGFPAVIYDALADYAVDALIEVEQGLPFSVGTEIAIAYNGETLGTAELTAETSAVYLSELLTLAGVDQSAVRTPLAGHAGRTDTWVFTIVLPATLYSELKVQTVVSGDDFATETAIASGSAVFGKFGDLERAALKDLKDGTSILEWGIVEGNIVYALIEYPEAIGNPLADYTVDALIKADDAFAAGTEVAIYYAPLGPAPQGVPDPLGIAVLEEATSEIYLSELLLLAGVDESDVRTPLTAHAGRVDGWVFIISSPVDVDTNVTVSSVVSNDDFATAVEITGFTEALDFLADKDTAEVALIGGTEMALSADGNVVTAEITYPDVISGNFAGYATDAEIERVSGDPYLPAGVQIAIDYNGAYLGTAVLDMHYDSIPLSELLILAGVPESAVRTCITGHVGRTDTWKLTISSVDDVLIRLSVTSLADHIELADSTVDLNFAAIVKARLKAMLAPPVVGAGLDLTL